MNRNKVVMSLCAGAAAWVVTFTILGGTILLSDSLGAWNADLKRVSFAFLPWVSLIVSGGVIAIVND